MSKSARILVVDDNETNRDILVTRLEVHGYELLQAADGEEAIAATKQYAPDLILLDVMMPKLNGIDACRQIKQDESLPFIPIVLVTAKSDTLDVVQGLEAGADEYLIKPLDQVALVARVKSMLRIKALHDQVRLQAADLAKWNQLLEQRVAEQVSQLDRMGALKRFLSPQITELILSAGNERMLESHRREVTIVFCDLRGFTSMAELAEPEELMAILGEYHAELGAIVHKFEGTVERFAGDAIMIIFNDPLPCENPCVRAVQMASEMQSRVSSIIKKWQKRGHELGFGIGISHGFATLGRIGFEGRYDYAAIGTVTNLAARLCSQASDGQILVDGKVQAAIETFAATEAVGELTLKGFHRPVKVFNVSSYTAPTG